MFLCCEVFLNLLLCCVLDFSFLLLAGIRRFHFYCLEILVKSIVQNPPFSCSGVEMDQFCTVLSYDPLGYMFQTCVFSLKKLQILHQGAYSRKISSE